MALDGRFFLISDILESYLVDKDSGLPLANGTLTFYRDVARNTSKPVYQLTGAPPNYTYTALPNPVPLSSVGTPQNAGEDNISIYGFPYDSQGNLDLYYVVCRDSNGVVQFTREAIPNITDSINPQSSETPIQNQISDPQFTQVFINENQPTIYNVTSATNQEFAFAPNWDFVISGTGSVTIQRMAVAGNDHVPTSPPYVLDVTVSGSITSCLLRQRFNVNSGLWATTANSSIFLAATLIARNEVSGTVGMQMFYVESNGSLPFLIIDSSFDNSGYSVLTGVTSVPVPSSHNTDSGNDGYVDIYLSFAIGSHVKISSIQVVPTFNETGANFLQYDLNSSNREQALMGSYYIPRLNSRSSSSILTGWDFTLNPFQFSSSGNLDIIPSYICDQTIALRSSSALISFSRDPITSGLSLMTIGNDESFYLMQYLSGNDAKKILGTPLSVNIFGYMTSSSNDVTLRVYLFRAPSSVTVPILPISIGSLSSDGLFTVLSPGWTEIPRSGLDTATAILPSISTNSDINNNNNDIKFIGWELIDSTQIGDTDKFAMVVTFFCPNTATAITINSISLIPSDIPARPSTESSDEVLRKCQYYYEKSYDLNIYAGQVSNNGLITSLMNPTQVGGSYGAKPLSFSIYYNTRKRISVNPIIIAPDGTIGSVFADVFLSGVPVSSGNATITGNWTQTTSGQTSVLFQPINQSVSIIGANGGGGYVINAEANIFFQFVADCRLGIV